MMIRHGLVLLAMATAPLLNPSNARADVPPNSCPPGSSLICNIHGCQCYCPDGSNANLTPPRPACPAPPSSGSGPLTGVATTAQPNSSPILTPASPPRLPGLRIRPPQTKPKPFPQPGDPAH